MAIERGEEMTDSFITDIDLEMLAACDLHRRTPYVVRGVSQTQLSVARHYGGCTYNGQVYVYQPLTDELIRNDVLKCVMRLRKKPKSKPKQKVSATEKGLFDD
jgi:hypothetical protein